MKPCAISCELIYCRLDVEVHESEEPASEKTGEASSERDASRAQWTSFFGVRASMSERCSRSESGTVDETKSTPSRTEDVGENVEDVKGNVDVTGPEPTRFIASGHVTELKRVRLYRAQVSSLPPS